MAVQFANSVTLIATMDAGVAPEQGPRHQLAEIQGAVANHSCRFISAHILDNSLHSLGIHQVSATTARCAYTLRSPLCAVQALSKLLDVFCKDQHTS